VLAIRLPGLDSARTPVLLAVAVAMIATALIAGWWPAR